jgi:hypothetical protein
VELIETQKPGPPRRGRRVVVGVAAVAAGIVAAVAGVVIVGGDDGADAVQDSIQESVQTPETSATTATPPQDQGRRLVPDPEEAALVEATPTGRPYIDSDSLQCLGPDPSGMPAPDLPSERWAWASLYRMALADPITADRMAAECADIYWYPEDRSADDARACISDAGTPPVVVTLDGLTCADAAADGGVSLRPLTDDDLAELNRLRAIEIGLLAAPHECATVAQASTWVEGVLAEEGLDLTVHVHDGPMIEHGDTVATPPPECPYHPRVSWAEQSVYIEPFHS